MDILWKDPRALYGLWLLVPVALLLLHGHRRRRRARERFADAAMAPRLMPRRTRARAWARDGLLLAGLASLVLAGARPLWGLYFDTVTRKGADLMVLLDVSRSMLSRDVPPSRLERAKSDVRDLLKRVEGDRVGLIAFAGKAVVACPLTADRGYFESVLAEASPDTAPRGGTAIGDAIRKALTSLERTEERDQALILITDGEDHDSFPEEAAALAAGRGVKIFAVGMGDPVEGARVPVVDPEGNRGYMKYEGKEIWSKMDEALLRKIALDTGGAYIPARTSDYDLGEIYEKHLAKLAAGSYEEGRRERHHERFQLFLALGLACLAGRLLMEPFARRAAILLLLAVPVHAGEPEGDVSQGLAAFRAGEFEKARGHFAAASKAAPEDPIPAFDEGAALHALGKAEDAKERYLVAAGASDPAVASRARHNLGTLAAEQARALFGKDPLHAPPATRKQGLELLDAAEGHLRACLDLDPHDDAARRNLERIKLWRKRMEDAWKKQDQQQEDILKKLEELMKRQRALRIAKGPADDQEKLADLTAAFPVAGKEPVERMRAAAAALRESRLPEATRAQAQAYDLLDTRWGQIAPFERVVGEAVRVQQENLAAKDLPLAADDEGRVGRLAALFAAKAQEKRTGPGEGGTPPPEPPTNPRPGQPAQSPEPPDPRKKAIELSPRIQELARGAEADLSAGNADQALPKEKEALDLLKQILPPQDQQKDKQQRNDQQKKDQEQKKKDEQQKQDRQKQQAQQEEQQRKDQQQAQQEPQQLSPEQVEALLRKAEERERAYKEKKKEQEKAAAVAAGVKRDW